ncbi:MAG: HlyD family efflux transporter periplasmic adaptor subunit [Kiritimatiellia bacterium]
MNRLSRLLPIAAAAGLAGCARTPDAPQTWHRVQEGPFHVWTVHEGRIESRNTAVVMSSFAGGATIVEIAPEGSVVKRDDTLVVFDSSAVEREIVRLRRDAALAKSDLETLEKAKQPVELRDLESALLAATVEASAEASFLKDSEELRAEDLVSETELEQQRQRARQLEGKRDAVAGQLKLTKEFLHPSALERARATLEAADESLRQSMEQLSNCVVRAPAAGTVVHTPLHIGAEYRTARVGDMLYKNQPFLEIPDFSNLVVRCAVPEAALSGVPPGNPVVVIPSAFPDLRLKARVERVGSMAQAEPGRAEWQRFFVVTVALDENDPRLRTGMSATCQILSHRSAKSLTVPRRAVRWQDGAASVLVKSAAGTAEKRDLQPGRANASDLEVLGGLAAGDEVLLP